MLRDRVQCMRHSGSDLCERLGEVGVREGEPTGLCACSRRRIESTRAENDASRVHDVLMGELELLHERRRVGRCDVELLLASRRAVKELAGGLEDGPVGDVLLLGVEVRALEVGKRRRFQTYGVRC